MDQKPNILVVDDEIAVCNSCMKTLARDGYDVEYALNGEEAIKKIAVSDYDLIITDLKMPKVDGMQLLGTVKKRWPEVNVIMITGYGTIRSAVEAMKLGAFDYVCKPFTSEELSGVAARALGLTEMERREAKPVLYLPIFFADLKREQLDRMWSLSSHSWARVHEDRTVTIGMDALYYRLLGGEMVMIELPKIAERVAQGESCAVISVKGRSDRLPSETPRHTLRSPVGGTVVEAHDAAKKEPSLVARSPYGRGWLIRIKPTDLEEDLKNLQPFTESIAGRVALSYFSQGEVT